MEEILNQIEQQFFIGPVWPASVLFALMCIYAVVASLGFVDLGMDADLDLDIDVDMDVDVEVPVHTPDLEAHDFNVSEGDVGVELSGQGMLAGLGALTVKWTNFGRVPIAIWGGVFTVAFWLLAYGLWHGFDKHRYAPDLLPSLLLIVRNGVMSIVLTKLITQPLVGKFAPLPGYDNRRIIGCTCEISSLEATPSFGQAKFRTDASPLLLNVKTDGSTLARGTEARIIDFHAEKKIYIVSEIKPEN